MRRRRRREPRNPLGVRPDVQVVPLDYPSTDVLSGGIEALLNGVSVD